MIRYQPNTVKSCRLMKEMSHFTTMIAEMKAATKPTAIIDA